MAVIEDLKRKLSIRDGKRDRLGGFFALFGQINRRLLRLRVRRSNGRCCGGGDWRRSSALNWSCWLWWLWWRRWRCTAAGVHCREQHHSEQWSSSVELVHWVAPVCARRCAWALACTSRA